MEGQSSLTLAKLISDLLYAKTGTLLSNPTANPCSQPPKEQKQPLDLPSESGRVEGSPEPRDPASSKPAESTAQVSQGLSSFNCKWTHFVSKATREGSPVGPALTSFPTGYQGCP